MVLGTWSEGYVAGLTAFRNGDLNAWLDFFMEATHQAINQAERIAADVVELRDRWDARFREYRNQNGKHEYHVVTQQKRLFCAILPNILYSQLRQRHVPMPCRSLRRNARSTDLLTQGSCAKKSLLRAAPADIWRMKYWIL